MKIERLNFTLVDLSESEKCKVSLANFNFEELAPRIKSLLRTLEEEGVTEVGELNISFVDLSDAEEATVE
ncbi:MAG: hypothetical protein ACE5J0_01350 [Candidatus Paceibacterales bacterium]